MKELLNILLVEDNPGDARIVQEFLNEEDTIAFKLFHVDCLSKGLSILSSSNMNVILCDLGLPDSNGIESFNALHKANSKIPIIVFTGMNESDLGLSAIKMGADDFLVKGHTNKQLLIRSIKYAIERKKSENRQKIIFQTLFILNRPKEWRNLMKEILLEIKQFSQIEEVAIQLQNGDEYPSIHINATSSNFIVHTNSNSSFIAKTESFWINNISKLLTADSEILHNFQAINHFNNEGYQSFALIPVASEKQAIGIIQLCDRKPDRFTPELIKFYEEIASAIGVVYNRVQIEKQFKESKKALQSALEKVTETDRLKTNFLSIISHELRTPLNAVIGFSSLIEKTTTVTDILEYSRIIHSSGDHLLEVVENILDFSLIETGIIRFVKSKFVLIELLKEVYLKTISKQDHLGKKGIEINFNPEQFDQNLTLNSDQKRIFQILTLLIDNALKFTKKGSIAFGFTKIIKNKVSLVRIYVKDTGIGISKDNQEVIFKIFRQVDDSNTRLYGGTGLGLAIAKRLVEILGGEIGVESEVGKGSTFYFTLSYS